MKTKFINQSLKRKQQKLQREEFTEPNSNQTSVANSIFDVMKFYRIASNRHLKINKILIEKFST